MDGSQRAQEKTGSSRKRGLGAHDLARRRGDGRGPGPAEPILASQRGAFLEALATELRANHDAIGVGAIHRIGRELQRQFLRHPDAVEARRPAARLHERRS
jgi:hypothetical protein